MSSSTTNSATVPSPPLTVAPRSAPTLEELCRMTSRPDERIAIRGVDWGFYEQLANSISERCHIQVDYDGRDVEVMSPGLVHDSDKRLIGQLVEAIAQVLGIPYKNAGQTTWKRPDVARGLEVDESYFFRKEKLDAVAAAKRGDLLTSPTIPTRISASKSTCHHRRLTGRGSMPHSRSLKSGGSMGSDSLSSSNGWRTTAATEPWTKARSCQWPRRKSVAGLSKKTQMTSLTGHVVSAPGSAPS